MSALALAGALVVSAARADQVATNQSVAALADLDLAQLMQIEIPTVVGASKHEQKVTEAPANVTIITQADIQQYGYRTMADILRSVPGFYVTYDRSYGFIGVRGFNRPGDYGGRVLMLINGHRINDAIYGSAAPATDFLLDVDLIERVEVIRGPGSSLYGNNAFFAVINVITRRGRNFEHGEVAGSAGSFDTYRGRATVGQMFSNDVEVVVSGSIQDSRGPRSLDVPELGGTVKRADDDQFASLFASAAFRGLTLEGGYVLRDKQVPNALYGTVLGDPRYQIQDERAYAELRYEHVLRDGTKLLARGYYDHYAYLADYPYADDDLGIVVINRDDQTAESAGLELRAQRTFLERHAVTAGLEFHSDFELRLKNYDVDPDETFQDTRSDAYWLAVYAQDEWRVVDKLLLNAGVRFDYYEDFGATVNPRLALIWEPVPGTTLKAIGGRAFRAPNAYERLYTTNVNAGNADLDPETITSAELIWEQALGRNLRSTIGGFYNKVTDLITQTTDTAGNDVYENLEGAQSYGAEIALDGQWTNGWRGRLSYTLAETEDDDGRQLDNSPRHLAKLNLVAPLYRDRVSAGLEVQYTGDRRATTGDRLDDFVIVNLTVFAHKFWRGWEASASLYNVFDTKYDDPTDTTPTVVEQNGREFRVKLTCRF